jgi:protein-disulfide isomerase
VGPRIAFRDLDHIEMKAFCRPSRPCPRRTEAQFESDVVINLRRAMQLSRAALYVLAVLLGAACPAAAQKSAGEIAIEPVSLPDMALGPKNAPVTIIDYSSMTCTHCALFEQTVLPQIKSKYIDAGYVRFVFREFPLDNKAVAASILSRCIAGDNSGRYFGSIDSIFRQQDQLVNDPIPMLKRVGSQFGMSNQQVETCLQDQSLLNQISADQKIAVDMVKIDSTPTFIINGRTYKGYMPFEQVDGIIRSQLGR